MRVTIKGISPGFNESPSIVSGLGDWKNGRPDGEFQVSCRPKEESCFKEIDCEKITLKKGVPCGEAEFSLWLKQDDSSRFPECQIVMQVLFDANGNPHMNGIKVIKGIIDYEELVVPSLRELSECMQRIREMWSGTTFDNSDRKEKRKQDIEEYLTTVKSESLKDALLRKGSSAEDRRKLSNILFKLCKLDDKEFTESFVALIAKKINKAPEETQGLLQEFQKRFIGHGLSTSASQNEAIKAIGDIGDVFEEFVLIPRGCPYIAGVADGALIAKNKQSEIVLVLIEFEGKEKSESILLSRKQRYETLIGKYIEISGSLIKIDCVELVLGGEAEQLKKDVLHMLSQKKLRPLSKYEIAIDWNSRDQVLLAVAENGHALEYASEELRADPDVVLAAVRQDGQALKFASEELRADPDVVLAAVRQDGQALKFASEELKGDREVVLVAVEKDGWALLYASQKLRENNEVVLVAVRQNGNALYCAGKKLKRDPKVVLTAMKQAMEKNGRIYKSDALLHASKELWGDKKAVLELVKKNAWALEYASEELQADLEVVLAAVRQDGRALKFASEELRANRDVVLAAVRRDGRALEFASEELKGDRELVLKVARHNPWALKFAGAGLIEDPGLVIEALLSLIELQKIELQNKAPQRAQHHLKNILEKQKNLFATFTKLVQDDFQNIQRVLIDHPDKNGVIRLQSVFIDYLKNSGYRDDEIKKLLDNLDLQGRNQKASSGEGFKFDPSAKPFRPNAQIEDRQTSSPSHSSEISDLQNRLLRELLGEGYSDPSAAPLHPEGSSPASQSRSSTVPR